MTAIAGVLATFDFCHIKYILCISTDISIFILTKVQYNKTKRSTGLIIKYLFLIFVNSYTLYA